MPLRDILVALTVFGSLPFCFLQPWIGVLVWSWLGYMNPHRLTWSMTVRRLPFAQLVAIATLGGLLLTKERYPLPRFVEVFLLVAMWLFFAFTTFFAINGEEAWEQLDKVSKIFVMTLVTLVLFQDRNKLRALIWVIALSIGFYGLKGGIFSVLTGGQHQVLGPPVTFMAGNTEIGLALNMILPLLIFLRREESRPWLRHLLLAIFGFCVIAIVCTYSRGALVGLAVVLTFLFLKSRAKVLAMFLIVLGLVVASSTLPDKWFGRMETIESYQEDKSAVNRLRAWRVSYLVALDNPVLGLGFRPFSRDLYMKYDPEYGPRSGDAHSIFFQVLAEHGFVGLGLYVALLLSTMLSLRRTMWVCRGVPATQWIYNYCHMLEASLMAYIASGVFLSMSYFDLYYHLIAIMVILKQLVLVERKKEVKALRMGSVRAPAFGIEAAR